MEEEKKYLLTREGVKKLEEELRYRKDVKALEIAEQLKDAKAQGDISENAEYDAALDAQRDNNTRIAEIKNILKNVDVADEEESDSTRVSFGNTVVVQDKETKEEFTYVIKGTKEANSLAGFISNESPLGKALIGAKKGQTVEVECPAGTIKYKIIRFSK
ncbi:MAG: transcription elongation factor GreA [Lachnospiraceae bacterium]|jgi:transcription elongation factor GreA|nr:transcription elongation factor GreA [Lachnospiraceae bacterium]MBR3637675.1 transcription elongation factor GreA [Lachnospiraceae bacterium]